jgi:hypothetical protein
VGIEYDEFDIESGGGGGRGCDGGGRKGADVILMLAQSATELELPRALVLAWPTPGARAGTGAGGAPGTAAEAEIGDAALRAGDRLGFEGI